MLKAEKRKQNYTHTALHAPAHININISYWIKSARTLNGVKRRREGEQEKRREKKTTENILPCNLFIGLYFTVLKQFSIRVIRWVCPMIGIFWMNQEEKNNKPYDKELDSSSSSSSAPLPTDTVNNRIYIHVSIYIYRLSHALTSQSSYIILKKKKKN